MISIVLRFGNDINNKRKNKKIITNGTLPIIISEIGLFAIPPITYKFIPRGGVINAISIFTMKIIANQIEFIPNCSTIGYKTGNTI